MENSGEIKIRALPRGNEEPKKDRAQKQNTAGSPADLAAHTKSAAIAKPRRWIIYVGVGALSLGLFTFLSKGPQSPKMIQAENAKIKALGQADLAATNTRINDSVTRHLQDAEIQRDMMKRTRELENAPFKKALLSGEGEMTALSAPEDARAFGVQMDSDSASERVFDDLNASSSDFSEVLLPGDKINAKIADRKWMARLDRAQRIAVIGDFIRSAYDNGYEVEIDQNLMVVGWKRINKNKILDINQVIDRLAKSP